MLKWIDLRLCLSVQVIWVKHGRDACIVHILLQYTDFVIFGPIFIFIHKMK